MSLNLFQIILRYTNTNTETVYRSVATKIVFDQPIDIKELKVSLVDSAGNLASLNNANFSFSLSKNISNSLLKQYEEMKFFNNDVSERILNARMLEYYDRENKNVYSNNQYSEILNNNIIILNLLQWVIEIITIIMIIYLENKLIYKK